jgi:RNA recognition motif. (a.k.a. RRM, RBD, or RNP domain)
MAENASPTGLASLPPPPPSSTAGAPGQQPYDGTMSNGQMNPHMPPPPLPPVVIPQNNNPIPTAMTSPMTGDMLSPTSSGGFVRRAAPEPNKRALYVGGLDARVTEEVLKQIFETTGHVQSVKIIPDKNVSCCKNRSPILYEATWVFQFKSTDLSPGHYPCVGHILNSSSIYFQGSHSLMRIHSTPCKDVQKAD